MASFALKTGVLGCLLARVAAFALPAPDPITTGSGWTAAGCYSEHSGARTLSQRVLESSSGSMTVEKCVDACHAAGYPIAGLEYYGGMFLYPPHLYARSDNE
jgi:hypothetical protein